MKIIISISVFIIAIAVFYSLVIAPMNNIKNQEEEEQVKDTITSACSEEASEAAITSLKSKSELLPEGQEKRVLEEAVSQDMYYTEDYDRYYDQCLKRRGVLE